MTKSLLAVLAWIFVACLTVQIFLAGLGVFVNPVWFQRHRAFVHAFGWLDVVMLVLTFAGKYPKPMKRLVFAFARTATSLAWPRGNVLVASGHACPQTAP